MSQVSQVRPGLYLSGSDPALRLSVLSSRSISLVVNASGLQDLVYPPMEGLSVLNVPLQDQPHAPLKLYFDPVGERIHQNRTGRTLVHCSAGRSRSPSLIIAYLMRFEGLSLRRAHEAVLEQRPFIRPNAGFWRQLMEYERSLFGRNTMRMVSTPGGVLPEALRLPEDLPEDLPEALRMPEDPEPAYCLNI